MAIHILDIDCCEKQDKRVKDPLIFYTSSTDPAICINLNGHLSKYEVEKVPWNIITHLN